MKFFRNTVLQLLLILPLLFSLSGIAWIKHTCHTCNSIHYNVLGIEECHHHECEVHDHSSCCSHNHEACSDKVESHFNCCTHNVMIFNLKEALIQDDDSWNIQLNPISLFLGLHFAELFLQKNIYTQSEVCFYQVFREPPVPLFIEVRKIRT